MNGKNHSDPTPNPVYQPHYKETQLVKFTKFVEQKYDISLSDYWKLHEWSCKSFPEFWECVWEFFGIVHSEPYTEVFDRSRSFHDMEWFRGARLNYTENIFKYRDSHVALIFTDESDNTEYMTYQQMYEEVCQYTRALQQLGVKKGDVVACFMSNKKEAVLAFLAVASLGAIWSGALPLLGVQALLARFRQISPKILFTSGNFIFDGKEIKMIENMQETVADLPTLEKVIFVPSKSPIVVENYESIPKCCSISEFLETARREYEDRPWDLQYEQVAFDYPLSISFTSGTTGRPKELYHSTGAFFASLRDYGIHVDITRKDVLFNFSPVGWISWNMFVNTLQLGVTLCMYEGANPYEQPPTRFWDLVDKFGITSCYIWSSSSEVMEKKGMLPTENHCITSLKQIFPMGSVTKPHTYDFFQRIKPGIYSVSVYGYQMVTRIYTNLALNERGKVAFKFIRSLLEPVKTNQIYKVSDYRVHAKRLENGNGDEWPLQRGLREMSARFKGTTEVYGLISGPNSNMPVYRGEMQSFALGMDVRCLDEDGKEVVGERGNLVIANPYPAMPVSIVKDVTRQKMRETYLRNYPGYWFVGDELWINPVTKGFILYGRCDETLNPQGARFSCSEIYFALEHFPDLLDSVCVSQYDSERNERVILFVKMKPGFVLTDSVRRKIEDTIEKNLTYEHVPEIIMQVPDIPYNLTGKKLNILVKKLINKMPVSNTEFVVNPTSVEFFQNVDLGKF